MALVGSKCWKEPAFLYHICALQEQFRDVLYHIHFGGVICSMVRVFDQAFDVWY